MPNARAQHEFEVTPFGGARFGGAIDLNTPSVDYLPIRSGWNYGATADYTLWPRLQAEFQFNHQPTSLDLRWTAKPDRFMAASGAMCRRASFIRLEWGLEDARIWWAKSDC